MTNHSEFADLGVDSGQLAIIPVELFHYGKHDGLDMAVLLATLDGGIHVEPHIGVAFTLPADTPVIVSTRHDTYGLEDWTVQSMPAMFDGDNRVMLPKGTYILSDPAYSTESGRRAGTIHTDQFLVYNQICELLSPGFALGEVYEWRNMVIGSIDDHPVIAVATGGDYTFESVITIRDGEFHLRVWFPVEEYADEDDEDECGCDEDEVDEHEARLEHDYETDDYDPYLDDDYPAHTWPYGD